MYLMTSLQAMGFNLKFAYPNGIRPESIETMR
ncbi:hypothetical protein MSG_02117 [Mycobacterium shigaense]|uniref:Uncharacterized protein n=1 Tax=Mycobacterium shigaense TaxID=722731 RepID=A0A1Z4EH68_9MYCO|nr:hypothetical protein MSG_02117 [Mycobacterium shigaense]